MDTTSSPYLLDISFRGFIQGKTIKSAATKEPLCHFFGGLPYAKPAVGHLRFLRPRPLDSCYRYGTRDDPGIFDAGASVCPQLGTSEKEWDEDCLQLNVWVPCGDPPAEGWPVYFYIHGGFLQVGSPNSNDLAGLLSETACKCIFIMPAYRLNIFGFLASEELLKDPENIHGNVGNMGFWDQRLALEWAYKNCSYFGGNPSNITVGGYSAGAHSAFHQLAYDFGQPREKSIVRRCIMWANGPGVQPKSLATAQTQFDHLLHALRIPLDLSMPEKLSRLRSCSSAELLKAGKRIPDHQFRAVSDGAFVRTTLFEEIDNGTFARQMKERDIKLMIGECRDEHFVYGRWRPPRNSLNGVLSRLQADYPRLSCMALIKHYFPHEQLPDGWRDWKDAFGRVYADVQIHMLERGFIDALVKNGAGHLIYRYRMEWRAKCVDQKIPKQWGVTHGSDSAIWFWGDGKRLTKPEKKVVKTAFLDLFAHFVGGKAVDWGTASPREVRRLRSDSSIDIWRDEMWDQGVGVWRILRDAREAPGEGTILAKL